MSSEFERVYDRVEAWCRARDYSGHDPFDALNSRLFQATPLLRDSSAARLILTQAVKRSPVNLRGLLRVPAGKNPKGTALFALAALARLRTLRLAKEHADASTRTTQTNTSTLPHDRAAQGNQAQPHPDTLQKTEQDARSHLDELMSMRLEGGSGAAWGYNFDWQSRNFYAPRGTPTLVPTAFAARAFIEASQAFGERKFLDVAGSVCAWILGDLPRAAELDDEVCFGYVPGAQTRIFNASLLAGETLASVGALAGDGELCEWGLRAARYVVRRQRADGSWPYGAQWYQSWIDNFHTAFVLESLERITRACGDEAARSEFAPAIKRGYDFWLARFFLADGWPKYYHDNPYPADIHAAAASIVALVELRETDDGAMAQAEKIARWTLRHLYDERAGFFYYQRRRSYTVRTPYMRWAQSWMLYALARFLEEVGSSQ